MTFTYLSSRISMSWWGAQDVRGSILQVQCGAKVLKQVCRTSLSSRKNGSKPHICTTRKPFVPSRHCVWIQRPTGPKGGSLSRRTICSTRQSARQMMSRRDDMFRTNMQEHSHTIEDMRTVGHACSRAARTRRTTVANCARKPRWTQHHQVHRTPRMRPRSSANRRLLSQRRRPMHSTGRNPVRGRHRKTHTGLRALHHPHKLGREWSPRLRC